MTSAARSTNEFERKITMYDRRFALLLVEERQRDIERRLRFRYERPPSLSIRQRIGVALIRIGRMLACEDALQLAARH